MTMAGGNSPPNLVKVPRGAWWNDANVRAIIYQVVAVLLVVLVGWYLVSNTLHNLASRHISTGFGFLQQEAGFAISETPIEYSATDHYARAFVVGLLNTLKLAIIGIVCATILGVVLGVARLSSNWLIRKLASLYVEVIRNIPLLLQLLFWYGILIALPPARQALSPFSGVFLSQRGLFFPVMQEHWIHPWLSLFVLFGAVLAWFYYRWGSRRQDETGKPFALVLPVIACLIVPPLLAFVFSGAPFALDAPELGGFNFSGGASISPEFTCMLLGLVTYTAAFIAEIVRAGILSVSHGQTEAARSLGLQPGFTLRLVVLPQALRVILPPLTSQYLNLTKNSSLAVAVGYPDLTSVANTSINQTGQAIEGVSMIMIVYLTISLLTAAFMNWYNARIALVER